MDKPTAIAGIARKLAPRIGRDLTWAQFTAAVTGLDADDKAALLARVRDQDAQGLGNLLLARVRDHVRALAVTEATSMLADDAVSLDELEQIL